MEYKKGKLVNLIIGDNTILFLLFLLGIGSFILSYAGMYSVASDSGFGWLSFLWPLVTEMAMIILSLTLLNIKLNGLHNNWIWLAIIACTILSSGLNIWHSPNKEYLTMLVWALPPIFLFASFKTWIWKIEQDIKKYETIIQVSDIDSELRQKSTKLIKLTEQLNQAQLLADNQPELSDKETRKIQLVNYLKEYPNATQAEMTEAIGVTRPTIKSYLDELGAIKNGKGWEV